MRPLALAAALLALAAPAAASDHSANAPAVPSDATLLLTVPANATRAFVEVQNQSGVQLQLVRDDGPGTPATSLLIAGVGAGLGGGGYASRFFKGRLRVYGPAGSQVAASQD